jgi:hypothetical protein
MILEEFVTYAFYYGFSTAATGNSAGTITNKLAAIAYFHKLNRLPDPTSSPQLSFFLQGVRRESSVPKSKRPASKGLIMKAALRMLRPDGSHSPRESTILGLLVVAFFFLLRRSEYASPDGRRVEKGALLCRDLTIRDKHGRETMLKENAASISIHLAYSKTDQLGQGSNRVLFASGDPRFCPVNAGWDLLYGKGEYVPERPLRSHSFTSSRSPCTQEG